MENIKTTRGYNFDEVTSAMQKAIRRNDTKIAGYFALELFHSNFYKYVWKRLLTISAEDCFGIITKEVKALYDSFMFMNEGRKRKDKGRIFISKAVILLCEARKSRESDHLQNFVYDKKRLLPDNDIEDKLAEVRKETIDIPEYAHDCHTRIGKMKGKTKKDFFKEEQEALEPKEQMELDFLAYEY